MHHQQTVSANAEADQAASVHTANGSDFTAVAYRYLTFSTTLPRPAEGAEPSSAPPPRPSLSRYQDPHEWKPTRKVFVTWLCCLSTLVTIYTPGAYAIGLEQYKREWGITTTAVYAGITISTLGFAIAPMILAPFSETHGRRPVFLAAGIVYVLGQLGSGVTGSFAGMLVTRALAGISCSMFSTIVGGVVSDIHVTKERNTAMAIFSEAALCGAGIDPAVFGVVAQHLS